MQTIQSGQLKITIDEKGAELKSIFHQGQQLEYMWSGDPAFWAKTSPVLFPIVGTLKNNTYSYNGKTYHLPRHGFAREKTFTVAEKTENAVRFTLASDASTKEAYPFDFLLSLIYTITGNSLQVTYGVQNTGSDEMLFSIGGHPAFKLPLVEGTAYDDYTLQFEKEETAGRWPISKEGLIETEPTPLLNHTNRLPLSKELFAKDAVVLKHLQSGYLDLVSEKTPHGLRFTFDGFPYLGLWAAPGADFVCIEPWQGIADSVNADGELAHKEGIIRLTAGEKFTALWSIQPYSFTKN